MSLRAVCALRFRDGTLSREVLYCQEKFCTAGELARGAAVAMGWVLMVILSFLRSAKATQQWISYLPPVAVSGALLVV